MNDIEKKALVERLRYLGAVDRLMGEPLFQAADAIEQHEAFRQEVSDALVEYFGEHLVAEDGGEPLARFIIAEPVDPLVEAIEEIEAWPPTPDQLVAALAKHGGKIVWENSDA